MFPSSVTMILRDVNVQLPVVEQKVTQSSSKDNAEKQPNIECHGNEHQQVAKSKLNEMQQCLNQMMSQIQSAPAHRINIKYNH